MARLVRSSVIQPAAVVRDLGLHLDSELPMKQHVNKVAAICYIIIYATSADESAVTIRLALALIMSRIDYCNSALTGLPQSTTAPLQRVQNSAARLVFELGPKEHVTLVTENKINVNKINLLTLYIKFCMI